MWLPSVRYGYLYGGLASAGHLTDKVGQLWSAEVLGRVVALFEREWAATVAEHDKTRGTAAAMEDAKGTIRSRFEERMHYKAKEVAAAGALTPEDAAALVTSAVGAFFEQGLLAASRQLLGDAIGSFGLVLSHSVDSATELVIGVSRRRPRSPGRPPPPDPVSPPPPLPPGARPDDVDRLLPKDWRVCFGSEASATKAGLGVGGDAIGDGYGNDDPLEAGFRFDLDDVNGEVVQLRWGDETKTGEPKTAGGEPMTAVMRYGGTGRGVLRAAHFIEGRNGSSLPFMARMLRLGGNPYVEPIPALGGKDAVGRDIADIPAVLGRIQDDWNEPAESMNRLTAYTLGVRLRQRMVAHAEGTHDGSVDLLICGCEVSLWVGEQFASDLHNAFPQLRW